MSAPSLSQHARGRLNIVSALERPIWAQELTRPTNGCSCWLARRADAIEPQAERAQPRPCATAHLERSAQTALGFSSICYLHLANKFLPENRASEAPRGTSQTVF